MRGRGTGVSGAGVVERVVKRRRSAAAAQLRGFFCGGFVVVGVEGDWRGGGFGMG